MILGACAAPPPPIAFRGAAPSRILVLPLRGTGVPAAWRRALDESAHIALAARGYAVVPASVVAAEGDAPSATDLVRLGDLLERFRADAVLERTAEVLGAASRASTERIEIRWRILGHVPLATIWESSADLRPGAVVSEHLTGPLGPRSDDPLLSDEQIQGRGYGSNITRVRALIPLQIAEDVQRRLSARVPQAVPATVR